MNGIAAFKINTAAYPMPGEFPTNAQMFTIDTSRTGKKASEIRLKDNPALDPDIVVPIEKILREDNKYADSFMMIKEIEARENKKAKAMGVEPPEIHLAFALKKDLRHKADEYRYNMPAANEVF